MTEITMPRLSDSMEEGTILSWLLADGDEVSEGQELAEIETDKATVTFEAPASGTLEIVVAAGGSVAVGATIARVGAAAAKDAAGAAEPPEAPDTAAVPAAEAPPAEATPTTEAPPAEATPAPAASNGNGRVRATPLARRLAAVHGVDLAALRGTGPGGRIGKADVAQAAGIALAPAPGPVATPRAGAPAPAAPSGSAPAAGAPARADSAKGEVTVIVPGRLKAIVARRMSEAKATVPDFQVEAEADVTAALDMRAELKRVAPGRAPSLNDFVVKACALALRDHPRVNGSYRDGAFELYGRINVGIAVAGDDALVVPTVFDADRQSLGAIAAETRRLAGRVRSGEVSPSELSGATFTVSNLGMFGMSAITPVINPPQAAILGVGAARMVLARLAGEIVERSLMTLRLTGDHRILDGADAARFLADVVAGLQSPLALAL